MQWTVMRDDGTVLNLQFKKTRKGARITAATAHDDDQAVAVSSLSDEERKRFEEECAEAHAEGRAQR